jgi:membrane protein implicated in regulation of membrane protease activity
MEIFDTLDPVLKTFWYIAIPTSLIFVIQTILTFMGMDSSDGIDADFEGDLGDSDAPFQLFSFRNLINFLLGFSWSGLSLYSSINNTVLLVIVSIVIGSAFVYVFFLVISQLHKLAEDNSFKINNTLHKTAEVYLRIPARMAGKGKVMISVNGAYHELDAMTEQQELPSGSTVKVVRIESGNILIVESL